MQAVKKPALVASVAALALLLSLGWLARGPQAGAIKNPLAVKGQVAAIMKDGGSCSLQAWFELKGRRYYTGQLPYSKQLCSYKLGQSILLAYDRQNPAKSQAMQKVSQPKAWPAWLAGLILLISLMMVAYRWPRKDRTAKEKIPIQKEQPVLAPEEKPKLKAPASGDFARTRSPGAKDKAGWYPTRSGRLRWWDGSRWTENYQ